MQKLKSVLLAISLCLFTLTQGPSAHAFGIGPFQLNAEFCQNVDKIGAISNAYQIVQWPVAGFPGIVQGISSRSNVIVELCAFVMQVQHYQTANAIFYSANYLNKLTGHKWDEQLRQSDLTFNLANSVYDFEDGGFRKGSITSPSVHREAANWIKEVLHKKPNAGAAAAPSDNQKQQMDKLAALSYRRAIMKEAINCPSADKSIDYNLIQKTKLAPLGDKMDQYSDDIEFYKARLLSMAPKIANSPEEIDSYNKLVAAMIASGVTLQPEKTVINEKSKTPSPTERDAEDHPKQVDKITERTVQTFSVKMNDMFFDDFSERWEDVWISWSSADWDKGGNSEARFLPLAYECESAKIARELDPTSSSFDRILAERLKNCETSVSMNKRKATSLFEYYARNLKDTLTLFKRTQGELWGLESKYLGLNRNPSGASANDYTKSEPVCAEKLKSAEMQKLQLEQQAVSNQANEMIAEQSMKQTMMMEEDKKRDQQNAEDAQRKSDFLQKSSETLRTQSSSSIAPNEIRGGM